MDAPQPRSEVADHAHPDVCFKASAWLLTMAGDHRVAVGERELVHVIPDTVKRVATGRRNEWIGEQIEWQNHCFPLFDIADASANDKSICDIGSAAKATAETVYVVAAYQPATSRDVAFGVLALNTLPVRIEVTNDNDCPLPQGAVGWRPLSHSCFRHQQHGPVPILDLQRVFSCTHRGKGEARS